MFNRLAVGVAICLVVTVAGTSIAAEGNEAETLAGLWHAKRYLGPEVRGNLSLLPRNGQLFADVAGFLVPVRVSGDRFSFELPGKRGEFRGTHRRKERVIRGFWFQPPGHRLRPFGSPVVLRPLGRDGWQGEVKPLDETGTFFLSMTPAADGKANTYLRDFEFNEGYRSQVRRVHRDGNAIQLFGNSRAITEDKLLLEGQYKDGVIVLPLFNAGVTYDFEKVSDDSGSSFYPRGRSPGRYRYAPPVARDDGWPVASLEDVGISRAAIEGFVQMLIDAPLSSVSDSQIHSLLIARHGKLVLEEYFHGFHGDQPHDTRSASKSWTAVLIGAAMVAGVPIRLDTPVYQTMLGSIPADLDPRKRAMTLEHLLTMTAGYDCDERDPTRPGHEDVMQDQSEEPDWYRFFMNVPLVSASGEKIVYCSGEPNLAAGMLEKVSGEPLPEMFDRLVAQPLQIRTYHLTMTPTGTAYGGGGHYFRPRDFMKMSQLMLNRGKWNGKTIISEEWAKTSGSPLRSLSDEQQYGYLWNSKEYPYKDRKVRGYFAAGNGGQIFMGIPDLDLVIVFTGGNYGDSRTLRIPQRTLIPQYILPAVN